MTALRPSDTWSAQTRWVCPSGLGLMALMTLVGLTLAGRPALAQLPSPPPDGSSPEETPVTLVPVEPVPTATPIAPRATPSARAATLAPPPPEPVETTAIMPPLSIYDSGILLTRAMRALNQQVTAAAKSTEAKAAGTAARTKDPGAIQYADRISYADRILQVVIAYVDQVDQAHPTLPNYAWESVSAEKVPDSSWTTQVFTLAKSIPHVTALALRVHHGDVEVKYLAAIDRNHTKWEFNELIAIPSDQPRPEICYLSLPTRLKEVRIVCRRADTDARNRARLFIEAGVSSVPESAKQAIYWLQMARGDLRNRRLEQAIAHIRQGYVLLKEYQESRKL